MPLSGIRTHDPSVREGDASQSRYHLPHFDAGHEHGKQTNEFAAQEQLREAAARNRYPALDRAAIVIGI
jgi:hypothetical protein